MSNQKGFAVIESLLVVIILAMIAGVGYYVWHTNQQTKATLESAFKENKKSAQPNKATTQQLVQYSDEASALVKSTYEKFGASLIKSNNVSKAVFDIHSSVTDDLYVLLNEKSITEDPVLCTKDLSGPSKIDLVAVIPTPTIIGVEVDTGRADRETIKVNVDHRLMRITSIVCPADSPTKSTGN